MLPSYYYRTVGGGRRVHHHPRSSSSSVARNGRSDKRRGAPNSVPACTVTHACKLYVCDSSFFLKQLPWAPAQSACSVLLVFIIIAACSPKNQNGTSSKTDSTVSLLHTRGYAWISPFLKIDGQRIKLRPSSLKRNRNRSSCCAKLVMTGQKVSAVRALSVPFFEPYDSTETFFSSSACMHSCFRLSVMPWLLLTVLSSLLSLAEFLTGHQHFPTSDELLLPSDVWQGLPLGLCRHSRHRPFFAQRCDRTLRRKREKRRRRRGNLMRSISS